MKNFFKLLLINLLVVTFAIADEKQMLDEIVIDRSTDSEKVEKLKEEVISINEDLKSDIWITRYNNYLTYRELEKELAQIKKDAKKYANWKGETYKELSYQLYNKIKIN